MTRREIEARQRANEALDEVKSAHWADVAARRSHSSELQAWACRQLRGAGISATIESTVEWALNGRRLSVDAAGAA